VPRRVAVGLASVLLLGLLVVLLAWPAARVLQASVTGPDGALTLRHYGAFFLTWGTLRLLVQSLALAVTSTAITVGLAAVLAFAVLRAGLPGRGFVAGITLLTLFAPPFLVSLALVLVVPWLGLDAALGGFTRLVLAQVLTFLPHAYLIVAAVLATVDRALEEAAENLGAGGMAILGRVTLVLARPGLLSAALVVFVLCLADFANPALVGGQYGVLATEVFYQAMGRSDTAGGAVMATVLLVPCLAAHLLHARWRAAWPPVAVPELSRHAGRPVPPALRWALALVAWLVALALLAVYGTVALGSVVRDWGSDWSPSAVHYAGAGAGARARALAVSLVVGLLAGIVGTMVALLSAYVIGRWRPPGWRALAVVVGLPAAVPGTVLGLAYLLAFAMPPLALTGTVWPLAASIVAWKLSAAVGAALAVLRRLPAGTEETAHSLGAGAADVFLRVTLPVLLPTALVIVSYFLVEGVVAMSPMVFLVSREITVGSVEVLVQVEGGRPGGACAIATIMVLLIGALALALRRLVGPGRVAVVEGLTLGPRVVGRPG
jgi:iron(III) transport system permease protein